MVRVSNLGESLEFFCDHLGLVVLKKMDNEAGRYTLVFLGTSENSEGMVEPVSYTHLTLPTILRV